MYIHVCIYIYVCEALCILKEHKYFAIWILVCSHTENNYIIVTLRQLKKCPILQM